MAQAPPLELVLQQLDSQPISPPSIIISQHSLVYKKVIVAAAAHGWDIRAPGRQFAWSKFWQKLPLAKISQNF
jgi:hypothetical protein